MFLGSFRTISVDEDDPAVKIKQGKVGTLALPARRTGGEGKGEGGGGGWSRSVSISMLHR